VGIDADTATCKYKAPRYDPDNRVPPNVGVRNEFDLETGKVGVDLNRNFRTRAWGYTCAPDYANAQADYPGYFGPAPASEPETGNVQQFLQGLRNLRTFLDYHSFAKFILYPGEARYAGAVNGFYTGLGELLQQLVATGYPVPRGQQPDYQLGTPRQLFGYDATGTLVDQAALTYGARSLAIELDPVRSANLQDYQPPETLIRSVFEKNIRAALGLIAAAGQRQERVCCFFRRTITGGEREYLAWNVFGCGNRLPGQGQAP
jgi:hypothetical protein